MSCFLDQILEKPRYGFERNGQFYKPTHQELWKEFIYNVNPFRTRKNWLTFFCWVISLGLGLPLVIFLTKFFTWPLFILGFVYSMVGLGTHGTIWLHRYSSHRAYQFKNPVFRFICKNLVIKIVPEEVYAISHHVHHYRSEKPGDPYNVNGGWLYCFLADANHQGIAKNLSEKDYRRVSGMLEHTGMRLNSYSQYLKWGTVSQPLTTVIHYVLNWSFWYGTFYLMGGHALAVALFGMSGVWAIGIRTYNFEGHGKGKDQRQEGIDFNREDLSVNQLWPGFVAGEWHNNHHLYPNGARSGFLPYQIDFAWYFIRFYSLIGGIKCYRDYKSDFMRDHYLPYLAKKASLKVAPTTAPVDKRSISTAPL